MLAILLSLFFSAGIRSQTSFNSVSYNFPNITAEKNTISGYTTGILQTQAPNFLQQTNTSVFCSETISNGTTGIQGDNWGVGAINGYPYITLANITTCTTGINLQDNVDITMEATKIYSCNAQGLLLQPISSGNLARLDGSYGTNTFELNNKTATANRTGEIEIADGGRLRIYGYAQGNTVNGGNNLIRRTPDAITGNPKGDVFIYNSSSSGILPIGFNNNTADDRVDTDYWAYNGGAAYPYNVYTPLTVATATSLDPQIYNLTYSRGKVKPNHTGYYLPWLTGCVYSTPPLGVKGKVPEPLSVEDDTTLSHCQNLILSAEGLSSSGQYQNAYDTYRSYIESCAYLSNSWETFMNVGEMNTVRSNDMHRDEEYRDWLKKVLYYNLDTNFYCADVSEILGTFHWFNDKRGKDYKGNLAVMYFLVQTKRCGYKYIDSVNIPATWKQVYFIWQDSVVDSVKTPFDSTLPSLEDLGLGILRGQPSDVKKFIEATSGPIISNIRALENPFTLETKIAFTTREAVALKFEIFDVLGKKVFDGGNKVYNQGDDIIILPGTGLPHGELYGRFSASDGTVITIKLLHI